MADDSDNNVSALIAKGVTPQQKTDLLASVTKPLMEMAQLSRLRQAFNSPSQEQAHSDQAAPTAYPTSS